MYCKNGDLADGVWTFKVQIKDQVNHRKEQIVNYKYDFSLEAPEITITYNKPEKTVTKIQQIIPMKLILCRFRLEMRKKMLKE